MAGILHAKSVQLAQVALAIPGQATERSIVRRLERLLDNPALRVRPVYEPIARTWLLSQARSSGQVRLIIDASKVSFSHRLLMVALAFGRRAIPIAWTWQPGAKGHCSARVQLALLTALRHFARLSRLTLALVLLYDWLMTSGTRVIKQGLRSQVDRPDRRDLASSRLACAGSVVVSKMLNLLRSGSFPVTSKLSGS